MEYKTTSIEFIAVFSVLFHARLLLSIIVTSRPSYALEQIQSNKSKGDIAVRPRPPRLTAARSVPVAVGIAAGLRLAALVLADVAQIDAIAIGQHHLLVLVVDVAVGDVVLLAVLLVRVARDARLVRVLALHAIRIDVAVATAVWGGI